jgi:hypothetical protein
MNNYDDRELARELRALAGQIAVPSVPLRARRGPVAGRVLAFAGVIAAAILAFVIGSTLTYLRSSQDNGAAPTVAPYATATASPTPSGSASAAQGSFPDVTLFAGSYSGMLYRISGGQVVGNPVRVCGSGESVLTIHPAPSGQSILAICGGATAGQAVLVDAATMAIRGSQPVVERDDVAAWAPDGQSIALLQFGVCDPQAPVCVHVSLWDLTSGTTRVIRPDEALTGNLRWTSVGLSVSLSQVPGQGTLVWDGRNWTIYSPHRLWIVDASGNALLVEAPTGMTGGRVWKRVAGQEQVLTAVGQTEWPLGLDGDRAIVSRDLTPTSPIVTYRGQQEVRVVPVPAFCLAAQPWDRWLICTTSGSAALAYSLDSDALARQPIAGLASFSALAALPKK